jgi:cell division protein FtsB
VKVTQKILMLLTSLALIGLMFIIVLGDNGFADRKQLRQKKNHIVEKNKKLRQENLELYRAINRLKNDPKYIENIARQELGMIGKDELIFKFKKPRKKRND